MFERAFKVIMLGDNAVGKTSLLHRYLRGEFKPEYVPTIKTSIYEKEFKFPNYIVRLLLWDLGAESEFNEIRKEYCADARAAIIVYDVCRPSSFKSVDDWYRRIAESASDKLIIWLVGNKIDLEGNRLVDKGAVEKKTKELGIGYMEVSAKTGENIEVLFTSILKDLIKARLNEIRMWQRG
jgi:small GTP-binding protein